MAQQTKFKLSTAANGKFALANIAFNNNAFAKAATLYIEAKELYKEALSPAAVAKPGDPANLDATIKANLGTSFKNIAVSWIKLAEKEPARAEERLKHAMDDLREGEALTYRHDEVLATAYHNLGLHYQAEGKTADATTNFEAAAKLRTDTDTHYNFALSLLEQGDKDGAKSEFVKTIKEAQKVHDKEIIALDSYCKLVKIEIEAGRDPKTILREAYAYIKTLDATVQQSYPEYINIILEQLWSANSLDINLIRDIIVLYKVVNKASTAENFLTTLEQAITDEQASAFGEADAGTRKAAVKTVLEKLIVLQDVDTNVATMLQNIWLSNGFMDETKAEEVLKDNHIFDLTDFGY